MNASATTAGTEADWVPGAAAAIVVVAIAMAGGGYGGVALGIGAAATWIAVLVVALGPARERLLRRPFVVAASALAVLAIASAFSLGWSLDRSAGFADVVRCGAYLGAFALAGVLIGPGRGRPVLAGLAAGLVIVSLVALASRLAGLGAGDAELVAVIPPSAGRLSYPVGYWNALGSVAAMAVPLLVWIAFESRRRPLAAAALAAIPAVVLAAYMTSSRGALIAIAAGAAIAIAAAPSRSRALAGLLVGVLAAVPALVTATLAGDILDAPLRGAPGGAEWAVLAALVAGIAAAALLGPAAVSRSAAIHVPGLRMRHVLAAAFAVVVAVVLLAGPARIAGDFAATSGQEADRSSGQLSVTGSGRAQFWSTALGAFADAPLKGIGAGSYGLYWNRHGQLETPVQNAHSEPLELLAELGIAGLAAFAAFFAAIAVPGIGLARSPGGAAGGAALGLIATALVGILIDWTWEVPAVAVPVLLAAAVCANGSLRPAGRPPAGPSPIRVPAPAAAVLAIAFAVPAIWSAGVLAVASDRLAAADDALAAGRLDEAAAAARAAAAAEPWSAEPWLRLATIEQSAGNLDAARRDIHRAIELTPADFRPWLMLASGVEAPLGNRRAVIAYAARAGILAPLIIPRAAIDPDLGS